MGIEIEKKYRLTAEQRSALEGYLQNSADAKLQDMEFEENTLFAGPGIDPRTKVLRLRLTEKRAVFTYKERDASSSAIRRNLEEETEVTNASALRAILSALGYTPQLVYEKRRATWHVRDVELVVDELPFGLFAEIEGEEEAIKEAEQLLGLTEAPAEMETYPELAAKYGVKSGETIEARFEI